MANREELAVIRGARTGHADSQLTLGRLYLFGSAGLPRSLPSALYWLDRAARQGCPEAWELIGNHIPLELARDSREPVTQWYERAYDTGLMRAGMVYAQLILGDERGAGSPPAERAKAMRALGDAARAGFPEAQGLLAREPGSVPRGMPASSVASLSAGRLRQDAGSGQVVTPARFARLAQDWDSGRHDVYLARALPLARAVAGSHAADGGAAARLAPEEVVLLSRCARLLEAGAGAEALPAAELQCFWELAAAGQDRHGQLALGLRFARMRIDGKRLAGASGAANFRKAVRWLQQAGEQGMAEAWYALSRIYIKPEFSQRNVLEAQKYLEQAAAMGYRDAQLECGNAAWRARRENENNDVRALFWLQRAAAQGCPKAAAAVRRIAPRPGGVWKVPGMLPGGPDVSAWPLLAARLELALAFGLSRAEALLLDLRHADRGHCLVIDIRASYGRSRRRLLAVASAQERQLLDRLRRLFDGIEGGPAGPEGNYRQRLYRLRSLFPDSNADDVEEDPLAA
jgi:TPR repeat protein